MNELKQKLGSKVKELNPTAEVAEVADIVEVKPSLKSESGFVALTTNAMEIISENLKNQQLTSALFDVIKSPSGGATSFSVPSLSGEDSEKELVGIILDYTTPRAYWTTPEPAEGTPPECFSRDSVISSNGERCATCVHNTFGSKDGDSNAKACKESVEAILLRPDSIMPVIVRVPVSSKLLFQKYTARLSGQLIPIHGAITKITLTKAVSKGGKPYATYNFEMVRQMSADEAVRAKAYADGFKEVMQSDDVIQVPTKSDVEGEAA
jgi:hypothetical protein